MQCHLDPASACRHVAKQGGANRMEAAVRTGTAFAAPLMHG
jgi:hypothetical protein